MSRISDIRDSLTSIVETALPDYTKVADAIQVEDNALQFLNKGFAVGYGPGEGVYDEWCMGQMHQRREFRIAVTNLYQPNAMPDYRESLETALAEDQFKVISAITKDITLTGVATNSQFAFDGGVEYLEAADGKQYIAIVSSFSVDYIESV